MRVAVINAVRWSPCPCVESRSARQFLQGCNRRTNSDLTYTTNNVGVSITLDIGIGITSMLCTPWVICHSRLRLPLLSFLLYFWTVVVPIAFVSRVSCRRLLPSLLLSPFLSPSFSSSRRCCVVGVVVVAVVVVCRATRCRRRVSVAVLVIYQ